MNDPRKPYPAGCYAFATADQLPEHTDTGWELVELLAGHNNVPTALLRRDPKQATAYQALEAELEKRVEEARRAETRERQSKKDAEHQAGLLRGRAREVTLLEERVNAEDLARRAAERRAVALEGALSLYRKEVGRARQAELEGGELEELLRVRPLEGGSPDVLHFAALLIIELRGAGLDVRHNYQDRELAKMLERVITLIEDSAEAYAKSLREELRNGASS